MTDELIAQLIQILSNASLDQANNLLTLVLKGLLPFALMLAYNWYKVKSAELKAKAATIEDANLRAQLNDALVRLDNTASTVVAELENTIKKFDAKGKVLDPDELKMFAHGRIKNRLLPEATELLQKRFGLARFDEIVDAKVEQKALDLKLAQRKLVLRQVSGLK